MSYHLYKTEAFVLDERPFGEANKVFYLLTPDLGLVTASAQGIRLLKSKLRYYLSRYAHLKITLVRGKETWRLVGAEKAEGCENIYQDHGKLDLVARVFLLLKQFIQGEGRIPGLFEDLKLSLAYLDSLELENAKAEVSRGWELTLVLRILHRLGYIKDDPKLRSFIVFREWSKDMPKLAAADQGFLVRAINDAIAASHI